MRALLAVASILFLLATPSWAVLGGTLDTVVSDRQRLHGELRSTTGDGFTVHEIAAADGTVVRQYASPSGLVFGVAWRGPFLPDLSHLLGSFFPELQRASPSAVRRRGPLVLRTDRLVVETGGHTRDFHGRAYLPAGFPPAVSEGVVR